VKRLAVPAKALARDRVQDLPLPIQQLAADDMRFVGLIVGLEWFARHDLQCDDNNRLTSQPEGENSCGPREPCSARQHCSLVVMRYNRI